MKKISLRKCIVTNEMYPKDNLLRVVKNNLGSVFYDPTNKAPGRGAYISKSVEAIEIAKKRKSFDKAFKISIDSSLYDTLVDIVKKERK